MILVPAFVRQGLVYMTKLCQSQKQAETSRTEQKEKLVRAADIE